DVTERDLDVRPTAGVRSDPIEQSQAVVGECRQGDLGDAACGTGDEDQPTRPITAPGVLPRGRGVHEIHKPCSYPTDPPTTTSFPRRGLTGYGQRQAAAQSDPSSQSWPAPGTVETRIDETVETGSVLIAMIAPGSCCARGSTYGSRP